MKQRAQLIAGIASLVALLTYTLVHTGGLLAYYIWPGVIGYVAAFGIEASVVSLSLRIGELRKSKQSTAFFVFVLVSVVIVSAIANVAEGFRVAQGVNLSLTTVKQLDIVQGIIGLTATGLISLIVLALSEIVGTDVTTTIKQVEKERKKEAEKPIKPIVNKTGRPKQVKISRRRDKVLSFLQGGMSKDDMADKLNVSVRTIQRDITATNGQGK